MLKRRARGPPGALLHVGPHGVMAGVSVAMRLQLFAGRPAPRTHTRGDSSCPVGHNGGPSSGLCPLALNLGFKVPGYWLPAMNIAWAFPDYR